MSPYAFYLDAAACSGCKACQIACKDRYALPAGVLWRRVYEVSGGGWWRDGAAWRNDAFAYNLSIACNHCERPVCVDLCPTRALQQRSDGLVLIDERRCIGCRYCEWACPYGAPQYDPAVRRMTKCTGCVDELARGALPVCVAACGLRALEFGDAAELRARRASDVLAPIIPPLPDPQLTRPALLVAPHRHAAGAAGGAGWTSAASAPTAPGAASAAGTTSAGARPARVANTEEVMPGRTASMREPSLVAFTLLAQLAVGLFWGWLALRWGRPREPVSNLSLLAAGALLLAALAASLLHLGQPARAGRALANWRSSWLSREILLALLFGAGWVGSLLVNRAFSRLAPAADLYHTAVALLGLGLVYAMARVYRLRTVPAWNTTRTFRGFLLTALVLGALATAAVQGIARGGERTGVLLALFVAAAGAATFFRVRFYRRYARPGL